MHSTLMLLDALCTPNLGVRQAKLESSVMATSHHHADSACGQPICNHWLPFLHPSKVAYRMGYVKPHLFTRLRMDIPNVWSLVISGI